MLFSRIIDAWTVLYCMFKRWRFCANQKNSLRSTRQGVKTIVLSRKTAKWYKSIGFCTCKIGYVFGKSGLHPGTTMYIVGTSMLILAFAEKPSKCALKLHSKFAFENYEI